jgi:hypothetical protein
MKLLGYFLTKNFRASSRLKFSIREVHKSEENTHRSRPKAKAIGMKKCSAGIPLVLKTS